MSDVSTIPIGEARERIAIELTLCQAHVDNSSQRVWQSSAITLAGALAMLGLMLQISATQLAAAVITTLFALGSVGILASWQYLISRERMLQKSSITRMSQLEDLLGFRREDMIKAADNAYPDSFMGATTTGWLISIGRIAQLGWVVVAAWRWLIYTGVLD